MHELNKQNSLATLETIEEVISAFKALMIFTELWRWDIFKGLWQDIACLVRRIKS